MKFKCWLQLAGLPSRLAEDGRQEGRRGGLAKIERSYGLRNTDDKCWLQLAGLCSLVAMAEAPHVEGKERRGGSET